MLVELKIFHRKEYFIRILFVYLAKTIPKERRMPGIEPMFQQPFLNFS
ncbi:hypothetical protein BACCOPRO_01970 [Phocaeicola coprophilus DSM 18228 = JCM 13818]|uniref:Uncharacterized protein n=1 Tax=Phocaeicola coprophilus DSM 18228 = JCM 13818 TaxID=547042 RepID=S0F8N0_9BACT|nr:hypothetical protein BACCOPRO_01970 [Phocaeicola coprophilus DSM 18228 = JCM 13818]